MVSVGLGGARQRISFSFFFFPLSRFLFITGAMAEVVINEDNYLGFASGALYGVISNQ